MCIPHVIVFSAFSKCQISHQRAAFLDLLEGLGHFKRLGTHGSAQAGIGYRKTVMQVRAAGQDNGLIAYLCQYLVS